MKLRLPAEPPGPRRDRRDRPLRLIVTTNLPFGEWTEVFSDPRLAKAVIDRLTHRAHIIDTGTESWRFRHGPQKKTRGPPDDAHVWSRSSTAALRATASGLVPGVGLTAC